MAVMPLLVIGHIIGAVLGVGAATFAEILYMRAMRDGVVEPEEGATLRIVYRVMRIGLYLTLITGFSFLLYFRFSGNEAMLFDGKLWAKMTIVLIIPLNALLMSFRKIPMWLGSAVSLTSWYAAVVLGVYRTVPFSYVSIIVLYVIAVFIVAAALSLIRDIYYRRAAR